MAAITDTVCETKHAWIKKLFLGLAALVISVGGLLFASTTGNSSQLQAMEVKVLNNKEHVTEVRRDIRDIKREQTTIQLNTAKILGILRGRRNITKGDK